MASPRNVFKNKIFYSSDHTC